MKQLRYFEALARTGQFGRAAEDCAITQPALSMQIKELEGQVGAPLVERSARQVRLTALGQQFAARAREILRSVDELGDLSRADGDGLSGPLRIGVIASWSGPYADYGRQFDAGMALYGVSALLSLTGTALVIKRKNG